MKTIFLNDDEDLAWARSQHRVPKAARAVVLYGNEDAPERIDCFLDADPRYGDAHFAQVIPDPARDDMLVIFATLYDELVEAGVEVRGRESDLSFKLDALASSILKKWTVDDQISQKFRSADPADAKAMICEIPFAFMPYWRKKKTRDSSHLKTIIAYRDGTGWAFDDPTRGLRREALVCGADDLLHALAPDLRQVRVQFFAHRPPTEDYDSDLVLSRIDEPLLEPAPAAPAGTTVAVGQGTWYSVTAPGTKVTRVWLCPALSRYFRDPPKYLFVKLSPVKETR
jgi:hypothetical protein